MNTTTANIPAPRKHYINNEDFCAALVEYKKKADDARKTGKSKPPIPNYIGECFLKIAEGFSHKHNFINYPYREEMVADGIENCLMYFENFDPQKSKNAFAYFTQIIYYAFLRRIQREKKHLYTKYKYTEQFGAIDDGHENGSDIPSKGFELYDNISEFIENFEENKRKRRDKKKNKPKGIEKFLDTAE